MVTYKNMQIPFMPQSFFDETKVTVKKNYILKTGRMKIKKIIFIFK